MDVRTLCDRCLGRRLVGAQGHAAQQQAGAAWRSAHDWPAAPPGACPVCEDAFHEEGEWLRAALEAVAPYEAATLQVGTRFPASGERAEQAAAAALGLELGETVRTEANRRIGPAVAAARGAAIVTDGRPDVTVTVDTRFWTASASATSVFVQGRYTKHRRDMPQTHWPCKSCQGRGCHACEGTGIMYATSVEDEIAKVLVPAFQASGASFHGAGREDIDALMLGSGRPFIMELHDPKLRSVALEPLEQALTGTHESIGVTVQGLRMASKDEVAALKAGAYDKAYLAHCETGSDVTKQQVRDAAAASQGRVLEQRTPERVSHRRADLVRRRTVHEVRLEQFDDARHFTLFVLAESGTYIKEFVSGDDGRTVPSFADALGVPCRVASLDVMGILD